MLLATFVVAQLLGLAASRIRMPGAGIVVPMFGSAAIAVGVGVTPPPFWTRFIVLVLMGTAIGAQIDRRSFLALRRILGAATLAGVGLIAIGVATTLLLRALGIAPVGDLLATSPGALSAMTAAALENDLDAPTVAVFHITRIFLIVLSIPLLVRFMHRSRSARQGHGRSHAPDAAAPTPAVTVPTEPVGHRVVHHDVPASVRERASRLVVFLVPAGGAALVAALGLRLGGQLPIVVNAFVGAGVVALLLPATTGLPKGAGLFVQSGLAWLIGSLVTRETIATLGPTLVGATLSAVALIGGGLLIALAMRRAGVVVEGDVLATSPGALEVLTLVGAEQGASVVDVGLFHLVRLLFVMLTLPLLLVWTQ